MEWALHEHLGHAFKALRAAPDDAFVRHPKDPKLYVTIEGEGDLEGSWSEFAGVFAALKKAATAILAGTFPDLACAHDQENFKMRLLRYPPTAGGEVRGAAHTDYGTLSLIFADGPGLEVKSGGEWIPAAPTETAPVIVVGSSLRLMGRSHIGPTET